MTFLLSLLEVNIVVVYWIPLKYLMIRKVIVTSLIYQETLIKGFQIKISKIMFWSLTHSPAHLYLVQNLAPDTPKCESVFSLTGEVVLEHGILVKYVILMLSVHAHCLSSLSWIKKSILIRDHYCSQVYAKAHWNKMLKQVEHESARRIKISFGWEHY